MPSDLILIMNSGENRKDNLNKSIFEIYQYEQYEVFIAFSLLIIPSFSWSAIFVICTIQW